MGNGTSCSKDITCVYLFPVDYKNNKQTTKMVQGVVIEDGCIVNTNPATGLVLSRVKCTTESEIDEIVKNAKAAVDDWSKKDAQDRVELLREGLKELGKEHDELVELIVQEMGKPKEQAVGEMEGAANKDAYLEILLQAQAKKQHGSCFVYRQAIGVVVVLSPWNFPVDEILLLALPALGAGNTVIVKPSEVTPECGARTVLALAKVLPAGVLQLAQGDGQVGSQLVSHPLVDMVAMTGSSTTGKAILSNASKSLKRVVLELGGKDPMVVFEDADLDKAARDAVKFSLVNSGQVCCAVERVFVAESVVEAFEAKVVEHAQTYKVGNGLDPETKVGPLVSMMQRDFVAAQVDQAIKDGAKLLLKSEIPDSSENQGSYHPVIVLSNVNSKMEVFSAETFGPVVAISTFDGTESEGIRLANDTEYGLAGSVYTQDMDKAKNVASQIKCGQVGINCYVLENMDIACPWVGHKSSGFGYHSGVEGFHQFSLPKTMVFEL